MTDKLRYDFTVLTLNLYDFFLKEKRRLLN